MKKLSKISESIWSDIQDRSAGEVVRDEDKFNPDYVDFGPETTVYWAINNLEVDDGEVKFYFDDVKDYNNNGWRLPTVDEVNQLKWNVRISWKEGCKHLEFDDGNELRLKTNGSGGFHMWTKEINTKFPSSAYAYGFDNSYIFDVNNFNKSINRLFVFLVKDKKVTESIWSDIQDRSSGETVRKEDDINHMDIYEFWEYLRDTYISQHPNRDTIDSPIDGAIAMPFFMKSDLMMYMLWIEFNDFNNHKIECISLPDVTVSKYDGIEDVFNIEGYSGDETRICVLPKDGSEITNSFAVKVIDYLLNQAVDDKYRMFIKKERS